MKFQKTFIYDGFQGTIIDIGQGGLQIKTQSTLSVGQVVAIAFTLPDRLIRFVGRVVYTRLAADGSLHAGINFDQISEGHASAVARYIGGKVPLQEMKLDKG